MRSALGKVQQAIMDKLDADGYVITTDMEGFSQPSLSRAVTSLERRGLVFVWAGRRDIDPGCPADEAWKNCPRWKNRRFTLVVARTPKGRGAYDRFAAQYKLEPRF
jgi:hypothetical protein